LLASQIARYLEIVSARRTVMRDTPKCLHRSSSVGIRLSPGNASDDALAQHE